MAKMRPRPSVYDKDFIAANQVTLIGNLWGKVGGCEMISFFQEDRADNLIGGTKQEQLEQVRKTIIFGQKCKRYGISKMAARAYFPLLHYFTKCIVDKAISSFPLYRTIRKCVISEFLRKKSYTHLVFPFLRSAATSGPSAPPPAWRR